MATKAAGNGGRREGKDKDKPSWDPDWEPFMKLLVGRNAIRTQQAAEVGRRAVEYFRGKDFYKWIAKNRNSLEAEVPLANEVLNSEDLQQATVSLGSALIRGSFIYRAKYLPVGGDAGDSTKPSAAPAEKEKPPKWPRRLEIHRVQSFEEDAFYVICYEGSRFWRHAMLAAIITAVLVVCMFPAWPLMMKLAVWYISVILLTLILGLCVGRLIFFVLLWFFGVDFWFIPNLFDEYAGVIDSFVPMYSFDYRGDTWLMVAARLFCGVLLTVSIQQLGKTHSISDVSHFARRQFLDALDWGHQKLAPPPEVARFPSSGLDPLIRPRASPSTTQGKKEETGDGVESVPVDAPIEEEEDFTCLQKCGFATFDELMEDCITECRCMEELLSTPCYRRCPDNVKRILDEARLDACATEEQPFEGEEAPHEEL